MKQVKNLTNLELNFNENLINPEVEQLAIKRSMRGNDLFCIYLKVFNKIEKVQDPKYLILFKNWKGKLMLI